MPILGARVAPLQCTSVLLLYWTLTSADKSHLICSQLSALPGLQEQFLSICFCYNQAVNVITKSINDLHKENIMKEGNFSKVKPRKL